MSFGVEIVGGKVTMPDTFIEQFDAARESWRINYLAFADAMDVSRVGTQIKVEANNAIYRVLIDTICDDGQLYFKDDEAVRREYSFEAVSEQVSPSGSSTAVITVLKRVQTKLCLRRLRMRVATVLC